MTLKQRLFVSKYLEYGIATKAALEVYNAKNRSSAAVIGSRLLRNVNVKREIDCIFEANKTFPAYIVINLKKSIENGTPSERIKALQMALRLQGYNV